MSLSEKILQSQIALNQNTVAHLHWRVQDCLEAMQCHIEEYKYHAGLHPDKERIKKIKAAYFSQINALKREIAKYVKLQKALKAELKGVRQQKAMVRAFLKRHGEVVEHYEEILKATQEADNKDNFATDEEVKAIMEAYSGDFIIR